MIIDTLFIDKNNVIESLNKRRFKHLLEISTSKTHFIYKSKIYDEINGYAMGSPLASILANIFMNNFENKYMNEFQKSGVIKWW